MKQTSLCLLLKEDKILLAMKKRGFGAGLWNGTGGKFNSKKDKDILETVIRETKEEIGVEIKNPEKFGLFHFRFPHKPEYDQDVHLYISKNWDGEPLESEEMDPKWFSFEKIPYNKMWDDDKLWLPLVLEGKKLEANFIFKQGDKIINHNIKIIEDI